MKDREPENLQNLLTDIFRNRGIRFGVFDLDGTLINSVEHYSRYMDRYSGKIANLSGEKAELIRESMEGILNGLRPEFSVNPALMLETARIIALQFGVDFYDQKFQPEVERLMDLYQKAPKVFDGVHESLDVLKPGLTLVVATHFDDPWTRVRLAKNGLLDYFEGRIFSFDSLGKKGIPEWASVLSAIKADPNEVIVAGDSIPSDIEPSLALGVPAKQIFRVTTEYGIANNGKLHPEVLEIDSFAKLPYAICDRLL